MFTRKTSLLLTLLLVLLAALSALPSAAQDTVTALRLDEPLTGVIENAEMGVLYRLETDMPQAVMLQLASQTGGFAPSFRLLDGNGLVVQIADNASAQPALVRQIPLSTSNLYLEVRSATGVPGSYIVGLIPSAFAAGPTPLALGQSVSGSVDNAAPDAMFSFDAPADQPARLLVDSLTPNRGVVVSLRDALTGELLGLNNMRFGGVDFDILPASGSFLLEILHTGTETAEGFTVCYTTADAPCGAAVTTAACAVTPAGAAVNIRAGASTGFAILGTLPVGESATVQGRSADGSWMQIGYNGLSGWVAASVVVASGDCTAVPPVTTPPVPPVVATQAPQVTPDAPTPEPEGDSPDEPEGGNGGGGIPAGPGNLSSGEDDGPDPTAPGPEFDIVLPGVTPTPQPPGLNLGFSN